MRDPYEVLHEKEIEVQRLQKETAALRLVISMMEDQGGATLEGNSISESLVRDFGSQRGRES